MRPSIHRRMAAGMAAMATLFTSLPATASEAYDAWELLKPEFESTGGGGIIIKEYRPVVAGAKCLTDFTATTPDGTVYYNTVAFDAVATQGGILCSSGVWRSRDGGSTGTTPLQVFIKDGIARRSP